MVLSFFRKGPVTGLDQILTRAVAMMSDARHSFDLATLALLTSTNPEDVADDIRATDQRINQAEQELRSELVVHVSVQGTAEIGSVLGFILLLKKIERIGDQAKNILDLAESGINLAAHPEIDHLMAERQAVSLLFARAAELLNNPDSSTEELDAFSEQATALSHEHQDRIDGYLVSDLPGREVVPMAIYFRYLKRIVANLGGIVRTDAEPIPHVDYLDDGATDTDD